MMAFAMGATQIELARFWTERFERFPAQLPQRHGVQSRGFGATGIGPGLGGLETLASPLIDLLRDRAKPESVRWRRVRNDSGGLALMSHGVSLCIVADPVHQPRFYQATA
jgi:hypothetical protein